MSAGNLNQGVPLGSPIADSRGMPPAAWAQFFVNLWTRTGGATPSNATSVQLDTISNVLGAILYRGLTVWKGLVPGAQYKVLRMGVEFPEWDSLDGNSFPSQTENRFFASPDGTAGIPGFRDIVTGDLENVAGQYPGTDTDDSAAAGNVGEYFTGTATTSLANGVAKDITSISLTPGDWDVWGNFTSLPAGSTTQTNIQSWVSTTSATDPTPPNGGAYAQLQTSIGAGLSQTLPLGMTRIEVTAGPNVTVYLSALVNFAASTLSGSGLLAARRAR